jgi:hypothetical protein
MNGDILNQNHRIVGICIKLQEIGNNHIQVVIDAWLVPKMIGYMKQKNILNSNYKQLCSRKYIDRHKWAILNDC